MTEAPKPTLTNAQRGSGEGFNAQKSKLIALQKLAEEFYELDEYVGMAEHDIIPKDDEKTAQRDKLEAQIAPEIPFLNSALADPALCSEALRVCDALVVSLHLGPRVAERIADSASAIRARIEGYPEDIGHAIRLMTEAYTALGEKETKERRSAAIIRHELNAAGPALQIYFSEANPPETSQIKKRVDDLERLLSLADEKNSQWICRAIGHHIAFAVVNGVYDSSDSDEAVLTALIDGRFLQHRDSENFARRTVESVMRNAPTYEQSMAIFTETMKFFGLPEKMSRELDSDAEDRSIHHRFAIKRVLDQLEYVQFLEQLEHGATAEMHRRFGIRWFSRYSKEVLQQQYKERDSDTPFGLFLVASNDWTHGMFQNNDRDTIDSLARQLGTCGRLVRIMEAAGKKEINQRFQDISEQYGSNCAQFLFIRAHSARENLTFGSGEHIGDDGMLHKEDLTLGELAQIGESLAPGAPIVFDGCSVGRKGGIAQTASKVFETKVMSPKGHQSALTGIRVIPKETFVDFQVTYEVDVNKQDVPARVYINGRER